VSPRVTCTKLPIAWDLGLSAPGPQPRRIGGIEPTYTPMARSTVVEATASTTARWIFASERGGFRPTCLHSSLNGLALLNFMVIYKVGGLSNHGTQETIVELFGFGQALLGTFFHMVKLGPRSGQRATDTYMKR
jgi:hypothetical protein